MEITLRPAQEEDIQFLLDLRVLTMGEYLEQDGVPCTEEENLWRIRYNFEDAKIVEINGLKAGLFNASYVEELGCWSILWIQLHHQFKNLKIGSYLLRSMIDKAQQQGRAVCLSVLKSNPAYALYSRFGFKVVEETPQEYELRLDA